MAYEKRVCVLKQLKKGFAANGGTLSGAVYCERLGDELTVTPRILALAPLKEGRYVMALCAENETFCMEAGAGVVRGAPSIRGGFSVLLCHVRAGADAEPVAFGACGASNETPRTLLAAITAEEKKRRKPANPLPPVELPAPAAPNVPLAPTPPVPKPLPEEDAPFRDCRAAARYDDEAIAADDYYAEADQNADAALCDPPQADPPENGGGACRDEAVPPRPITRGSLTYYYELREKLRAAFGKYPRDDRLKGAFPHSDWVNAGDALLGIVYEEGLPRYLCVATEEKLPAQAEGRGVFVPLSPFSDERGMYVVFQDADTGEYVVVEEG